MIDFRYFFCRNKLSPTEINRIDVKQTRDTTLCNDCVLHDKSYINYNSVNTSNEKFETYLHICCTMIICHPDCGRNVEMHTTNACSWREERVRCRNVLAKNETKCFARFCTPTALSVTK